MAEFLKTKKVSGYFAVKRLLVIVWLLLSSSLSHFLLLEFSFSFYVKIKKILGHNLLSSPGFGASLDQLDKTCKDYRDCLTCASDEFGQTCAAEIRKVIKRFCFKILQTVDWKI